MLDFERIEKMLKGRVAVKKEFEKEFMVNKEKLDEILSSPIDGDTFRKSLTCCIHKILDDYNGGAFGIRSATCLNQLEEDINQAWELILATDKTSHFGDFSNVCGIYNKLKITYAIYVLADEKWEDTLRKRSAEGKLSCC